MNADTPAHTSRFSIDGVAGVFLARLRLLADRLDAHPFYQCADMSATYSFIFPNELVTKHARAHELIF